MSDPISAKRTPLDPEDFLKLPRFQLLQPAVRDKVRKLRGCLWLLEYAEGAEICTRGQAGNTAFYLLGEVDRLILGLPSEASEEARAAEEEFVKKAAAAKSPADRLRYAQCLAARAGEKLAIAEQLEGQAGEEGGGKAGAEDAVQPGWLRLSARAQPDRVLATIKEVTPPPEMRARELVGEMALLNRQPRRATVTAARACAAVEVLDNVFQEMWKDKAFEEEVTTRYLARLREFQLRELPLLNCLSDEEFEKLFPRNGAGPELPERRVRVERKLRPNPAVEVTVCEQGAEATEIYLIRQGWVQVKVSADGQERVVAYRGPGEFIGELALFGNSQADFKERIARLRESDYAGDPGEMFPPGKRTATCTVVGHPRSKMGWVELVVIPYPRFWELVKASAKLRRALVEEAVQRLGQLKAPPAGPRTPAGVGVFLQPQHQPLGLYRGTRLMLIDLDRCTRCDECVRGCVGSHGGQRTRLYLEGPRARIAGRDVLVPRTCRSCDDPVCMAGCPTRAIQRGNRGQIVIRDTMCIGCSSCANNCPFGSIQMHDSGLIPDPADGWFYLPARHLSDEQRRDWPAAPTPEGWLPARTPFTFTRDEKARLAGLAERPPPTGQGSAPDATPRGEGEEEFLFWRYFDRPVSADDEAAVSFEAVSPASEFRVWIDGKEPKPGPEPAEAAKEKPAKKAHAAAGEEPPPIKRTWLLPRRTDSQPRSLLAISLKARPRVGTTWLGGLRLDQLVTPRGEWDILYRWDSAKKPGWIKPQLAVVCDLCEDLPEGPACVRACPHEAALRFDARQGMPADW